jgi:hypothetical protein
MDAGNPSPPGYGAPPGAPPGAAPAAPYGVPYGAPYGPPPASQGGGVAIASLVLGIIAVVLGFMTCIPYLNYCTCFLEPVVALIAIVLGIVGLSSSEPMHKAKATWGLILGIVGIVIWIALLILALLGVVSLAVLQEMQYSY